MRAVGSCVFALAAVVAATPSWAMAAVPVDALVEIARVPVEGRPTYLALTHDGARLLATTSVVDGFGSVSSSVLVIDTSTNQLVDSIPLGEGFGFGIAVTPDDSRAYVAVSQASGSTVTGGENRIAVVDLDHHVVGVTIMSLPGASAFGPIGIVLDADAARAYVTHRGSGLVIVVDTLLNSVVADVAVGGQPVGIDIVPGGDRVYAVERAPTAEVSVIDAATNAVVNAIPTTIGPSSSSTSVAVAPDGRRAYVTHPTDERIAVIDTDPASPSFHAEVGLIPTGTVGLAQVAISPDGARAFVVRTGPPGELLVLDLGTSPVPVLGSIPVGDGSFDVALQPLPQAVAYVSNQDSISVIGIKQGLEDFVAGLDDDAFSNPNHRKALLNKLAVVRDMIERGDVCQAIQKLERDVLPKIDGEPGPAPWITDAAARARLVELILTCIAQLAGSC